MYSFEIYQVIHPKITIIFTPHTEIPSEFGISIGIQQTESCGYQLVEKICRYVQLFFTEYQHVTDEQTHIGISRSPSMACCTIKTYTWSRYLFKNLISRPMDVERVSRYKILGVTVSSNLKWEDHVANITSKASQRLWFLKKLKRAGASADDMVYYYQAIVRSIMEYACPA